MKWKYFILCASGSSTACILVLDHLSNKLFTVNIGDSGFLVVRKGRVVHKSEEQQHYFNAPFQLSLPPPGHDGSALNDRYVFNVITMLCLSTSNII